MFELKIKIVSNSSDFVNDANLDEESIYGLLQLKVNSKEYGFFIDEINEPRENWFGDDLNFWLESYLDVLIKLHENNYVAISDIETENSWIEFKKNNDIVTVGVLEAKDNPTDTYVVTEPLNVLQYTDWTDEQVDFKEMINEIKTKVDKFLNDIKDIDIRFEDTKSYINFREKYDNVCELYQ